jgi:hypothetical protein
VQSILKEKLHEHVYKIQGVAVLQEEDCHMRMNFLTDEIKNYQFPRVS